MKTEFIKSITIQGSGIDYYTEIFDENIIDSLINWYNSTSNIKKEFRHTYIADPQLLIRLLNNESILLQADRNHSDIIQVTHIFPRKDGKGSHQVIFRVKTKELNKFIIKLKEIKEEKNNMAPSQEDILKIISDINSSLTL